MFHLYPYNIAYVNETICLTVFSNYPIAICALGRLGGLDGQPLLVRWLGNEWDWKEVLTGIS